MSAPKQVTLIAKYLTNTITNKEEETLNEWLTASKVNVDSYMKYLNAWEKEKAEQPKLQHSFIETLTFLAEWEKANTPVTPITPKHEQLLKELEIEIPELVPVSPQPQPVVTTPKPTSPSKPKNNKFLIGVLGVIFVVAALCYYVINNVDLETDLVTHNSGDEVTKIKLPDNTIVTLNKHSSLSYKKSAIHDIKLNGEAYFDVMESESPFTIECDGAKITAEGETFNVRSYAQDDLVEVAIEQGKATLEAANVVGNNILKGQSGFKLAFKKKNQIMKTVQNDNPTLLAWKEGKLDFKGQTLESVFETLERCYEVNIKMTNNDIGSCMYSHNFGDSEVMELEELLHVIAKKKRLKVKLVDDIYQISGRGCGKRIVEEY